MSTEFGNRGRGGSPKFGKSPAPVRGGPARPAGMKRSTKVILAVGGGSAALAAYMAMRQPSCVQADPANPQPCPSSSSSWRGGTTRWSSSSWGSRSTSTVGTQGVVSRGGFGATGRSFSGFGGS